MIYTLLRVPSLGWEDPLEKDMATHCSILAWRISPLGWRSLMGYSPWGHKESDMTKQLTLHFKEILTNFVSYS